MKYQVMPITPDYIDSFWEAVDSVSRERKYLSFLEGPPIETTRLYVLDNIVHGCPHFVAISEGQVIGWCDITPLNRPVYQHSGSLGLGVIAEFRRQGLGEHLMRTALEEAKNKGLTRIELTVRELNKPAFNLYIKLGFEVEGLKRKAVKVDDTYEDLIMMAKLF